MFFVDRFLTLWYFGIALKSKKKVEVMLIMRQKLKNRYDEWSMEYNSIHRNGFIRLFNVPKSFSVDGYDLVITNDTIYLANVSVDEFLVFVNFIRDIYYEKC